MYIPSYVLNSVRFSHTHTHTHKFHNSLQKEPDVKVKAFSPSTKAAESTAAGQGSSQNAGKASKEFEDGKIAGLQEAILAIMEKNGPVTDQMRRDVEANVYHDSLITWIKSFR